MTGSKKENFLVSQINIPNILSLLRLIAVPFVAYTIFKEQFLAALIIYVVACLTDALDGYIARVTNQITVVGKFLDPLADKLMQFTTIAMFTYKGVIPLVIMLIFFLKEFFMYLGGIIIYKREHFVVNSNIFGRAASALFFTAIAVSILLAVIGQNITGNYLEYSFQSTIMLSIALIPVLIAFVVYIVIYYELKQAAKNGIDFDKDDSIQDIQKKYKLRQSDSISEKELD
jgi:cardiolipin synthase